MLPFLVLLVASSALAAPSQPNSLLDRAFEGLDHSDIVLNVLNFGAVLRDISRQGGNQPLANGQALAALGEVTTGRPGDSCAAANYVNAYTRYVASGNNAGVREALGDYVRVLADNIDNIVGAYQNNEAAKYKTGRQGSCAGEGRTYQFEAAWDIILGSTPGNQQSLINEEYCVAKRLYCASNAVSNNVAAHVTASALPPTVQVFELSTGPLTNFLSALATRNNLGQSAASLKQAMASAVGRVSY